LSGQTEYDIDNNPTNNKWVHFFNSECLNYPKPARVKLHLRLNGTRTYCTYSVGYAYNYQGYGEKYWVTNHPDNFVAPDFYLHEEPIIPGSLNISIIVRIEQNPRFCLEIDKTLNFAMTADVIVTDSPTSHSPSMDPSSSRIGENDVSDSPSILQSYVPTPFVSSTTLHGPFLTVLSLINWF